MFGISLWFTAYTWSFISRVSIVIFLQNEGFFSSCRMSHCDISDGDKRRREAPAAEHPIADCALVWASVHGPEPLIYTHRPRTSRTARAHTGYPNTCLFEKRISNNLKKKSLYQKKVWQNDSFVESFHRLWAEKLFKTQLSLNKAP